MTIVDRMDILEVGVGSVVFWGSGQVRVVFKGPTGMLCVDPDLTDSDGAGGRFLETSLPPLAPHGATNADAVLLTHDHVDHTDLRTVLPLAEAASDARFVASFTARVTLAERDWRPAV